MISALAGSCVVGGTATADCIVKTSTSVVPSCGGFWVPLTIFVDLESAWSSVPSLKEEISARKTEARELRASLAAMTVTASAAEERAKLWEGMAASSVKLSREQAASYALSGQDNRGVLWCSVCALGAAAASVGIAHAYPSR